MSVRRTFSGIVATAVAGSALAVVAAPAHAAAVADDPSFTPVATDLIGAGSDTSQHAIHLVAEGFNAQSPAPAFKVASFAALGGGEITLPHGAITRPNGSGAGKKLLYGATENADVDFARSSSANSAEETQAGLKAFPFALDTLKMAVSNSVPSHAPAGLTPAQIVGIYKGEITNWSAVGGQDGLIAPKIPQGGSGTRSFFESQLKSMNGGVAVVYGQNVGEVQEHDDTLIKNDANAIAPFSSGRAGLLGSTLRLETGWKADRALYNVVRGGDLGRADLQAVFGENGFLCSTEARPLIEQAGFKQLATPEHDGVCGAPTTDPTSNFILNEQVTTATALSVSSTRARSATLVATVSGSTSPSGTVDFYEGADLLQAGVPLVSGQATYEVTGATAGTHSWSAVFQPAEGSVFETSTDDATGVVKTSSKITESFPAKVAAGKRAKGDIVVTLAGVAKAATGKVTVFLGKKAIAKGKLSGGEATVKLPRFEKGKNTLKVVWDGNSAATGAHKTFTIKQK